MRTISKPVDQLYPSLWKDLRRLTELHELCGHLLTRTPGSLRERVSGTKGIGTTLNEKVLALRSEMEEVLRSWALLVIHERRAPGPNGSDVRSLVGFLSRHADWIQEHPAAVDFAEEITALAKSAKMIAGPVPERRMAIGSCLQPRCSSTLYAILPDSDSAGTATGRVTCESGHALPPRQWLLVADRIGSAARRDSLAEAQR
ncbi:OvmZ protein [Streptomyces sp. NPDC049099]|uniref:OvmZ protein n=1 Tax=unclassified Streptomyces TaxID=2593676 RepID=UPI0034344DE2